jgi:hypothetical protein
MKDDDFIESYTIAEQIVKNKFERDGVWNHYYAHKKCKPYWKKKMTYVTIVGNHTFGYLKNYKD